MNSKKEDTVLGGALKFSVVPIVSLVLGVAVIPLVTRLYPPDEYAKVNLFTTIATLLMYFCFWGWDSGYIRFYNDPPLGSSKKQIASTALVLSLSTITVCTLGAFLICSDRISFWMFGEKNWTVLVLLAGYTVSMIIFRILNITYRMDENARAYSVQNILQQFITRVLFCVMAIYTTSYYPTILFVTICMILTSFTYLVFQRKIFAVKKPFVSPTAFKEIVSYSLPVMPNAIMVYLGTSISKLIFTGVGDFSALGVYSVGISLANVFATLSGGFSTYWSAYMYKHYKTEREKIKSVHNYILLIDIAIVILIIAFQDVAFLILGEKYRASQQYFLLLMISPLMSLTLETTAYGISIRKKTYLSVLVLTAVTITNVILSYLLIPRYGAMGASIAVASSALMNFVIRTLISQKLYSSIRSTATTICALMLTVGLCAANTMVYQSMLIKLLMAAFAGVLVWMLFTKELKNIVHLIRESVKRYRGRKSL